MSTASAYRISNKVQTFRPATEVNGLKEGIFNSADSTACIIALGVTPALGGEPAKGLRPRNVNGKW